ncbi:hypothetical protein PEX2_052250 [Penicillium expansum]|uniref:Probable beta-glucosidase M n=1 Tax=Penicillium expansum TaxID=27334 RepID=A0A0A2J3U1_PENEN|nr:hypothetical protein PEX2_052250 [Penicillium expansum]KGO49338.1 hypothetical protein PEX2_052250 [Penicillium expansum]
MVQFKAPLLFHNVAVAHAAVVQDDTYFYGQSPPVYLPYAQYDGPRGLRARTFQSPISGIPDVSGRKDRLGFPGMCVQDGPNGIKGVDLVNGYPSGIHVGASWNKSLAYHQAKAIGNEFRRKGATMALGPPAVDHLGRIALGIRVPARQV